MVVAGVPSEFFHSKGFAVSASVFGESLPSAYPMSMLKQSVWNMCLKAVVQMQVYSLGLLSITFTLQWFL